MDTHLTENRPPTSNVKGRGAPLSTPPWRGSLSTATRHRKYKCFQILQSARVASNHAIYRVFCGSPAKKPLKNRLFLKCLGFNNGRTISKNMERFCRKGFFRRYGGFSMAQNDGIYMGLRAFPPQDPVNCGGFGLCTLQSGHKTQ